MQTKLLKLKRQIVKLHARINSKAEKDKRRRKILRDIEINLESAMDHLLTAWQEAGNLEDKQ